MYVHTTLERLNTASQSSHAVFHETIAVMVGNGESPGVKLFPGSG